MSASGDALEQEVKDLRQDVAALRKALREETARRKGAGASGSSGSEKVERLRTAAADATEQAKAGIDQAKAGLDQIEQQIEEKPVQSVLIALIVGFILARILGR